MLISLDVSESCVRFPECWSSWEYMMSFDVYRDSATQSLLHCRHIWKALGCFKACTWIFAKRYFNGCIQSRVRTVKTNEQVLLKTLEQQESMIEHIARTKPKHVDNHRREVEVYHLRRELHFVGRTSLFLKEQIQLSTVRSFLQGTLIDQFVACSKSRDIAHELASQIWLTVLGNLKENLLESTRDEFRSDLGSNLNRLLNVSNDTPQKSK